MTELLTFRAYARRRGVSVEAVSKAVETGRISTQPGTSPSRRLIDPAVADREWAENTDPNMKCGRPDPETDDDATDCDDVSPTLGTLAGSKARKEFWAAETARLKYEELSGKLVDAAAVEKAAFDLGRTVREAIMGIPDRIAGELAGETDPHKVHVLLTTELRTALEGLADVDS